MTTTTPKHRLAGLHAIPRQAFGLRRMATFFFAAGSVVFILLILERFVALAGAFSGIAIICFLAWLLAFVVSPLVDGATKRLHIGRGAAVGLVYGCVALGFGAFVLVVASIGVSEGTALVNRTDEAAANISANLASLQKTLGIGTGMIDLAARFRETEARVLPELKSTLASQSGVMAGTAVSIIGTLFMTLVRSAEPSGDSCGPS
jgi:predicted PurR-regulated permease PerM